MDPHATKALRKARRALIAIVVSAVMAAAAAATLVGHEVARMAWQPTGDAPRMMSRHPVPREVHAPDSAMQVLIEHAPGARLHADEHGKPGAVASAGSPRGAGGKPGAPQLARPAAMQQEATPRRGEPTTATDAVDGPGALPDLGRQDLSREDVRNTIASHRNAVRRCYELVLSASPTATGTVTARFTITPEGTVTAAAATATGLDRKVSRCIEEAVAAMVFPRSASSIRVSYPFRFVPRTTVDP
jgi:hypothetical protein